MPMPEPRQQQYIFIQCYYLAPLTLCKREERADDYFTSTANRSRVSLIIEWFHQKPWLKCEWYSTLKLKLILFKKCTHNLLITTNHYHGLDLVIPLIIVYACCLELIPSIMHAQVS